MQHDDLIWSIIGNKQSCSYKVAISKQEQRFCRNTDNVTGLCNRTSCPLANSQYATIKEEEGRIYLYMKTAERAHTPKYLWERVLLPRNYAQAIATVEKHIEFWSASLKLKCKQRLTKIHQYLIRMRKLRKKNKPKVVAIDQKAERREKKREAKALSAAMIDKAIEKELLDRLKQNTYGDIYNFPSIEYESALKQVEEEEEYEDEEEFEDEEEEDDEMTGQVEFVEGPVDSDDDSDLEDYDPWTGGQDDDDEDDDDDDDDDDEAPSSNGKRPRKAAPSDPSKRPKKGGKSGKSGKTVEIEYEQEEEHEPRALAHV